MVNNCHAKRDIKTCSITLIRHCPAHIIIGRAIQWNMPSGVAAGLCLAKPDANKESRYA
ncbi:hypothetical protein [Candidatus Spongiihabitans sp.]|uniref:hypothetical protein n=1 Tax=Candidatus Spongiihabitans sp. TaxID=3101308 RepID=UPI003C7A93DD